jgi:hypothetical protein
MKVPKRVSRASSAHPFSDVNLKCSDFESPADVACISRLANAARVVSMTPISGWEKMLALSRLAIEIFRIDTKKS